MKDDDIEKKSGRYLAAVEFLFFAGVSCAVPFVSVHMRSLGLTTVKEVMAVHAASGSFVCLLVPLMVTFSMDPTFSTLKQQFYFFSICRKKRRRHRSRPIPMTTTAGNRSLSKWCLCCCLVISSICYSAFLAVPRVVRTPRLPLLDFDCFFSTSSKEYEGRTAALRLEKCPNWKSCREAADSFGSNTLFRMSYCRQKCQTNATETTSIPSYVLQVCFGPARSIAATLEERKKERRLCLAHDPRLEDQEELSDLEFRADLSHWKFSEFQNVSVTEFLKMDPRAPSYTVDVCAFGPTTLPSESAALWVRERPRGSVSCGRMPYATTKDCTIRCLLTSQTEEIVPRLSYVRSQSCHEIVGNPESTFWMYLSLRTLADVSLISILCLLDGFHCFHHHWWEKPHFARCDRSRTFPIVAFVIFPPAFGALVDTFGNYSPALVVSAGFQMIAMAFAVALPLPGCGPSGTYTIHSSSTSLTDADGAGPLRFWWSWTEGCFTLISALCLGMLWSFPQVFSAWLYQDLTGFEHWTIGLSESLCFVCSIPLLVASTSLLREVGETYLCSAAFAFHAIRHAGLSLVSSYGEAKYGWWWPLPLEAMKAVALPLGWMALCARGERALAHENHGQKRIAALHCILAVIHFGAGRVIGVCVGGALSNKYGFPTAFGCSSGLALILAAASIVAHFGYFRSRHRERQAKLRTRQVTRALAMHGSNLELCEPEHQWPLLNGPESLFQSQHETVPLHSEDERSLQNL